MKDKTFAIIGGGIGGLATCLALQQAGINAIVYERADELKEVGAGISLWANATRVLKRLGLLEQIIGASEPINFLEVKTFKGKLLKQVKIDNYEVPSVCIHRAALLEILRGEIEPERIKLNKTFVRYEQENNKVLAHFSDGSAVEADALIAADGLKSAARAQMKGDLPPVFRGYTIWRGISDFLPENHRRGFTSESSGAGQRFGWFPVGAGRVYWFATNNQAEGASGSPAERKKRVLEIFGNWHSPIPETINATIDEHVLQNDCYDREAETGWTDKRVLLLGDAAHPTTPNMGQGGCMALEDAVCLAKILQSESNVETAFQKFEKARFPRAKYIIESSRRLGAIGQLQNPLAVGCRNLVVRSFPESIFRKEQHKAHGFEI